MKYLMLWVAIGWLNLVVRMIVDRKKLGPLSLVSWIIMKREGVK